MAKKKGRAGMEQQDLGISEIEVSVYALDLRWGSGWMKRNLGNYSTKCSGQMGLSIP